MYMWKTNHPLTQKCQKAFAAFPALGLEALSKAPRVWIQAPKSGQEIQDHQEVSGRVTAQYFALFVCMCYKQQQPYRYSFAAGCKGEEGLAFESPWETSHSVAERDCPQPWRCKGFHESASPVAWARHSSGCGSDGGRANSCWLSWGCQAESSLATGRPYVPAGLWDSVSLLFGHFSLVWSKLFNWLRLWLVLVLLILWLMMHKTSP